MSTQNAFTEEKIQFVLDEINRANILIGGRPRSATHRRMDATEAQSAMRLPNWVFSDQQLEHAFTAAVTKYDNQNTCGVFESKRP